MKNKTTVAILLTTFNSEKYLREQLDSILKQKNINVVIYISDDGSTDGTAEALDTFAKSDRRIKILHNVHAGKAPTVKSGMLFASGEWRLFTDFDRIGLAKLFLQSFALRSLCLMFLLLVVKKCLIEGLRLGIISKIIVSKNGCD